MDIGLQHCLGSRRLPKVQTLRGPNQSNTHFPLGPILLALGKKGAKRSRKKIYHILFSLSEEADDEKWPLATARGIYARR